jgi:peptidoglycan hydrolase-like protein with peptidoglycan-binding domain
VNEKLTKARIIVMSKNTYDKYLLPAILLLCLIHPLAAQRWEEPQVLPDAPAFVRDLSVQNPRLQGEEIRILQERLISLGYTDLGAADGYFGPLTEDAFRRFASFNGVLYEGVVDREAWYALFSADRKENQSYSALGNRQLLYAFGMWGLFPQADKNQLFDRDLDPGERIEGYLHYPYGTVETVIVRTQWFWESGPYSANDFAPSLVFENKETSGNVLRDPQGVFSTSRKNPFYSAENIEEIPPGVLPSVQNWFNSRGIEQPINLSHGYVVYREVTNPLYILFLQSGITYKEGVSLAGYNVMLSVIYEKEDWVVTYVEGPVYLDVGEGHYAYRFPGFTNYVNNFAEVDGNGFPDVSLMYSGGAWGNGEKILLLGSWRETVRTIFGFGD